MKRFVSTFGIACCLLLVAGMFQNCSKVEVSGSPSPTTSYGNAGGFEGKPDRYIYADPTKPCADRDFKGSPLHRTEIDRSWSTGVTLLVRDECANLATARVLRSSEFQIQNGGSDLSYNGKLLTAVPSSQSFSQMLPNSSGLGGGGPVLPMGWHLQTLGARIVAIDVQLDPIFNVNYVRLQVQAMQNQAAFNLFVEPLQFTASTAQDTWTASAYLKIIAGNLAGYLNVGFHSYDSSNNYISEYAAAFNGPSPSIDYQRVAFTGQPRPGTASIMMRITGGSMPMGATYTLQFVAPQLERNTSVSNFLATP